MRQALTILALVLATIVPVGADPGSNQLTSWSALCTGKTEGVFAWSGAQPANCTNLPNRIIAWPDFTSNVTHTGTGCGTGNPLPTWGQLLTCRGAGSTLTSQNWSGQGITYTYNGGCVANGSTSFAISTPSNTVAPTSSSTQLTWTPSSIAAESGGTGAGISVALANPSGTTVITATPVSNGNTTPIHYSAAGAPAGAWVWTVSGLGSETCNGTTGIVHPGTNEIVSGSVSWYQ